MTINIHDYNQVEYSYCSDCLEKIKLTLIPSGDDYDDSWVELTFQYNIERSENVHVIDGFHYVEKFTDVGDIRLTNAVHYDREANATPFDLDPVDAAKLIDNHRDRIIEMACDHVN